MNPHSPYNSVQPSPLPTTEEKNWAVGAHLSAFAQYILPVLAFVIPIVILLTKGTESPFVAAQSKEALNFQISLWIWAIIGMVCFLTVIGILAAFAIWIVGAIIGVVCPILGAIEVSNGRSYRYPLTLRLIS